MNRPNSFLYIDVGAVFIMIGSYLMYADYYFKWPPEWVAILNDNIVGLIFAVAGVLYIFWGISSIDNVKFEHLILYLGGALMGGLTAFQFCHEIFLGIHYSWISNLGILGVLIYMAMKSPRTTGGGR